MNFPFPPNETKRLEVLQEFRDLDTGDEREYSDIARIASQICKTPYAAVSFIGETHQWFRYTLGFESGEIPRKDSFCSSGISEPEKVTKIGDLTGDARFVDNPLIRDLNVKFFAAAPLVTRDGYVLGSLCVFDSKPRELSPEQEAALLAAARQFTIRLELRRTTHLLREANEELRSLSLRDELTGLYNYRGFVTHAVQYLKLFRSRRTPGSMWMMFADMDGLKDINDRFGHTEGSLAIQTTADLIVKTIREADIVARLGGDEFTAMLLNTLDTVAEKIPHRIQQSFEHYNRMSGKPYDLALSVGLVRIEQDSDLTVEELLKQADDDMYREKSRRKRFAA